MKNNIVKIEKIVNYEFKDKSLLEEALTHSSFANENKVNSYERLEFLGDSLLEYIVSDYIYLNFPNLPEGKLTKLRAMLVQEKTLANILNELGISEFILLGKSLKKYNLSMACDVFESIIGAIYLDGGMEKAREFVLKFLIKDIENIDKIVQNSVDFKTKLQELLQGEGKTIEYVKESVENGFKVGIKIDGKIIKEKVSSSIKLGELELAREIYTKLSKQ